MIKQDLELNILLLETSRKKYLDMLNNLSSYFAIEETDVEEIKTNAEMTIQKYDSEIAEAKEQLNNLVIQDLKKDLLQTGKLDLQKIEETIQSHGIESIRISEAAKDMKAHQSKVTDIFNKHRKN